MPAADRAGRVIAFEPPGHASTYWPRFGDYQQNVDDELQRGSLIASELRGLLADGQADEDPASLQDSRAALHALRLQMERVSTRAELASLQADPRQARALRIAATASTNDGRAVLAAATDGTPPPAIDLVWSGSLQDVPAGSDQQVRVRAEPPWGDMPGRWVVTACDWRGEREARTHILSEALTRVGVSQNDAVHVERQIIADIEKGVEPSADTTGRPVVRHAVG